MFKISCLAGTALAATSVERLTASMYHPTALRTAAQQDFSDDESDGNTASDTDEVGPAYGGVPAFDGMGSRNYFSNF